MLTRKDTEELLSSLSFLISCMERLEQQVGSVENRLRAIERDHDRIRNDLNLDELVRLSEGARSILSSVETMRPTLLSEAGRPAMSSCAVVVPVFNAPAEVELCLAALFENGGYDELIVVDDGSDTETKALLERQQLRRPFRLITNPQNLGYTRTVNIGLREALSHDAVVILNSDTITTHGWLGNIMQLFRRHDEVGIIGPLSNAASYQSIPAVKSDTGEFLVNLLPEGITPDDVALALRGGQPKYPRVDVINGFCFALRTAMVKRIGLFDEEAFPVGYGEENDLCLRATAAGFQLAIADDTYVYHSKSASFGAERRRELAKAGRLALDAKHGGERVRAAIAALEHDDELTDARAAAAEMMSNAAPDAIFANAPLSVAYILPAKPGGGGVHSIVQEANYLLGKGVKTAILVPERELAAFLSFYDQDGIAAALFVPYRTLPMARDLVAGFGAVVATVYRSVELVRELMTIYPEKRFFYYVQDYEPYFHPEGTPERQEATESYQLADNCRFFAKTKWLRDTVFEKHGRQVDIVLPSLDHGIYTPGPAKRKNQICAMVRPSTPRRHPEETVAFASAVAAARGGKVRVVLFGEDSKHAVFDSVRHLPGIKLIGKLTRPQVSKLFCASDAFVDLSDYQAFGRASLEAMACGAAAIVPKRGGGEEYAVHGWNAQVVDTNSDACVPDALAAMNRIYVNLPLYRSAALQTAGKYSVAAAGRSIYKFFLGYGIDER